MKKYIVCLKENKSFAILDFFNNKLDALELLSNLKTYGKYKSFIYINEKNTNLKELENDIEKYLENK